MPAQSMHAVMHARLTTATTINGGLEGGMTTANKHCPMHPTNVLAGPQFGFSAHSAAHDTPLVPAQHVHVMQLHGLSPVGSGRCAGFDAQYS